jgi:hypothetical protein
METVAGLVAIDQVASIAPKMQSTAELPVRKSSPDVPLTVLAQVHVAQAAGATASAPASTNEDRKPLLIPFLLCEVAGWS